MSVESFAALLMTLAVHAGVLLTIAWIADRSSLQVQLGWREWMWWLALFGGIVTSATQFVLETPGLARISLAVESDTSVVPMDAAGSAVDAAPASASAARREAGRTDDHAPLMATPSRRSDTLRADELPAPRKPSPDWPRWHLLLAVAWLVGTLISLARLGGAWLRLRSALRLARPVVHGRLLADAAELAARAGLACPQLARLDTLAGPIAATGGRIILPGWVFERFDAPQMRAMLAHELAHLYRRDPQRRLAAAFACALLWFMPIASMARRRLDAIAEQSCDAWAAQQCGDRRALAECLAGCAERRQSGPAFTLAPGMAGRESPLLQRINHLLEGTIMKTRLSVPSALMASVAVLFVAVILLPGVGIRSSHADMDRPSPPAAPSPPAPPRPPAPGDAGNGIRLHVSSETDASGRKHQSTFLQTDVGKRSYQARIDGEATYTPQYDGIASLGNGASASFAETREGVARRIEYTNRTGKLERHYFVADLEQPIDNAVEGWIAAVIPEMVRETAIDVEKRVRQIHAAGGTAAVFDEIGRIHSDYARGEYLGQLASTVRFTSSEMTRALGLVDAFESAYERRRALTRIGAAGEFDAGQQTLVIGQAKRIESDYERAELLLGLLPKLADSAQVHRAWLEAANGIESDYEHRRCLVALIEAGGSDDAILATVIDAARTIESDYERRELLSTAIAAVSSAENVADAYAAAVKDIGGDYERREALLALIHARGFGAKASRQVLASLGNVESDHESSEVLVELAQVMPNDQALIERYRAVARTLSDHERADAERALDRFSL
ncbi:M56 family metallopeptidase [Dokdonella immobilis]|uniref:BlaR1 peptidase M56 n=1 Tax=Dokdonella immobilis TaxID=578942 RepID=A0A1I4YF78_9GAMM|nr:M56 family metallopeptidase [Dokdonella immobilis]SFN36688.1 BlaR1 peptidase M56 [Dokdonella immobilis]